MDCGVLFDFNQLSPSSSQAHDKTVSCQIWSLGLVTLFSFKSICLFLVISIKGLLTRKMQKVNKIISLRFFELLITPQKRQLSESDLSLIRDLTS